MVRSRQYFERIRKAVERGGLGRKGIGSFVAILLADLEVELGEAGAHALEGVLLEIEYLIVLESTRVRKFRPDWSRLLEAVWDALRARRLGAGTGRSNS